MIQANISVYAISPFRSSEYRFEKYAYHYLGYALKIATL